MSCPGDLYFDPNLNVCNWPDQVDCQPQTEAIETTTTEQEDTTTAGQQEKTTTEQEETTTAGQQETTTTEEEETTTVEEEETTTPGQEETTTELEITPIGSIRSKRQFDVVCPSSEDGFAVFVPHPTNCSLYYECVGNSPILMSCPGDLYFDPNLNVCNWPDQVDCQPQTEAP